MISCISDCLIMRKFYTILVAVSALFMVSGLSAQTRFGSKRQMEVSAGYTNIATSNCGGDVVTKSGLHGAYVGFAYDFDLLQEKWGRLSLEPGARLSYAVDSEMESRYQVLDKEALKESYLDIPVNLKYSYRLNYITVSAYAGPMFSLGMTSTSLYCYDKHMLKANNYTGAQEFTGAHQDNVEYQGISGYSRYDLKFGLGLGFTFIDRFALKAVYNFGLLNRYNGTQATETKISRHTNVFNIGLGYRF